MQYHQLLALASLASIALANPITLTKKQSSVCDQQRLTCGAAPGANQSLCASQKSACDACEAAYESYVTSPGSNKSLAASLRNECFAASAIGDGNGVLPIISTLSAAHGTSATPTTSGSPSTTSSVPASTTPATPATTCDQQRLTCGAAPGANQSLCAVQKNACDACEKAYESYVTSPNSNKSLAGALRAECFAASREGSGDGVVPIIASLSAAQAGGAYATPTVSITSTSAAVVTTPTVKDTVIIATGAPTGTPAPFTSASSPPRTTLVHPASNVTATRSATPSQYTGAAIALKPVGAVGLFVLGAAMVL